MLVCSLGNGSRIADLWGGRGENRVMRLATRPPLVRLLAIDRAIRAQRWPNTRTLADELEVDRRTIRRDLAFLRYRFGAPLGFDTHHNGYFYTEPSFRLPSIQLTEGELIALFAAQRLLQEYRGSPFGPDLERAFAKIVSVLADPITVSADALRGGDLVPHERSGDVRPGHPACPDYRDDTPPPGRPRLLDSLTRRANPPHRRSLSPHGSRRNSLPDRVLSRPQ